MFLLEGFFIAFSFFLFWGVCRLFVGPNYYEYKRKHPGHWL